MHRTSTEGIFTPFSGNVVSVDTFWSSSFCPREQIQYCSKVYQIYYTITACPHIMQYIILVQCTYEWTESCMVLDFIYGWRTFQYIYSWSRYSIVCYSRFWKHLWCNCRWLKYYVTWYHTTPITQHLHLQKIVFCNKKSSRIYLTYRLCPPLHRPFGNGDTVLH